MSDFFSKYKLSEEEEPKQPLTTSSSFFQNYSLSQDKPITEESSQGFFSKYNLDTGQPKRTGALPTQYSVTDLERNDEFMTRAARFMEGLGINENIFEYLRDADYSLSSAIQRSFETGKWTDEQKQDYTYLKNKFANAKLTGLKERLDFAKDFAVDVVADPLNVLSLLFAIPTFGGSLGAKVTAGKLSQEALKKFTTSRSLEKAVFTDTTTRSALLGAAEGAAWTGSYDFFNQRSDVGLGLREGIDYGQVLGSTALGGGLGGVLGGAVGVPSGYRYVNQIKKYNNEGDILKHTDATSRKEITEAGQVELNFDEESPAALLRRILLTEKPTTPLARVFDKLALEEGSKFSQFGSKVRYDWDYLLGRKKKKTVRGADYNENYNNVWGPSITRLEKALNPLASTGTMDNALSLKSNNDLLSAIVDPKATKNFFDGSDISPEARKAALEIREILDMHFNLANEEGLLLITQKVLNYFPHKINYTKLSNPANKQVFKELLIKGKHAEPLNEIPKKAYRNFYDVHGKLIEGVPEDALATDMAVFGRDFLADAGGNESLARSLKADRIIEDMLNQKYNPFQYEKVNQGAGGYGFLKHRVFDNISDVEMLPFIETDVKTVLQDYITASSAAIARSKTFGRDRTIFRKNFLKDDVNKTGMFYEMTDAGVSEAEATKVIQQADKVYGIITGVDKSRIENPALQQLSDWGKLTQQMAHLPLATISSITEPMIMLQRVDLEDVPLVAKELAKAFQKQTSKTIDRTLQGAKRAIGKETKNLKDLDDEYWTEIYESGLALEQSVQNLLEGLTGEALENPAARKLQELFFMANGLTPFTAMTQAAAFNVGKKIMIKSLGKLDKHFTGVKKLNKKRLEYETNKVNELGIDEKEGLEFYRRHLKDDKFDFDTAFEDDFYKTKITLGAGRFAREIVMDTRVAAANTPTVFSSPAGQLLFQFAKYPAAFNNTILKRFYNEALGYPMIATPKVFGTMLAMTAVATLGNAIRSEGRSLDKPTGEMISDSIRRWGGFGPLDYASRWQSNLETGGGILGATYKAPFGPLPADVIDTILYRQGPGEVFLKNLPFYSALPQETRQYLKKTGRDFDRYATDIALAEQESNKRAFATGGLVKGPKVPNVKEDPADTINKLTGESYSGKTELEQQMEELLP